MEFITIALALVDFILFGAIIAITVIKVKEYREIANEEAIERAVYESWLILNHLEDTDEAYGEWLDTICDVPDEVYEALFEALDEAA